ncbi:acyltransferase family protein [Granulicella arctica]|uniref:acyltransferase family protein n=1 Tax=Granulicella arctica TaxID=940613 RepID=UPI0021DFFF90|nr:acyltransferase [Granulicella arctica]
MSRTTSTPKAYKLRQSPMEMPQRSYYPGLDGLRAIAVVMVFLHHYVSRYFSIFGWGWTGVDLFFVLSGFLITGILYDSQNQPHRYRDFYMRRTLRIFPLYYALWFAVLIAIPIAQWQNDWHMLLWPAYLGNYARFLFLNISGDPYRFDRLTFGPLVQRWFGSPMHLYIGHLWSLCVEEQFYLLWPLVIYQLRRRTTLMRICVAVIVTVPLLRWVLASSVTPRMIEMELLYRSLPTRMDALLIGGLLALCLRGPQQHWLSRYRHLLLAASVTLLALAAALSSSLLHMPLKGAAVNHTGIFAFTLIDLAAAALILEVIHPNSACSRILSLRGLRHFGQISYGFYVYHDLLHDFYSYIGNRWCGAYAAPVTIALAFTASWAIAWLSYRFLEGPLLTYKDRFTHQTHKAPAA